MSIVLWDQWWKTSTRHKDWAATLLSGGIYDISCKAQSVDYWADEDAEGSSCGVVPKKDGMNELRVSMASASRGTLVERGVY
jgi:hypothetical protein